MSERRTDQAPRNDEKGRGDGPTLTIGSIVQPKGIPRPYRNQLVLSLSKTLVHHICYTVGLRGAPHHRIQPCMRFFVEQILSKRCDVRSGVHGSEGAAGGAIIVWGSSLVCAAEEEGSIKV
jgi:hypothetical protein